MLLLLLLLLLHAIHHHVLLHEIIPGESVVNLLRPGDFCGTAAEVKLFDDGEVGVDEIVVAHRNLPRRHFRFF